MGNLSVQKDAGTKPMAQLREWDPLRGFRHLLRAWDPFAEMTPGLAAETETFSPAFEVKETKEGFVFKADVPGVKEADLDIRLSQNRLSISGKRESEKTEETDTYYTYERSYGSFARTFTLPEGIDADRVKAELKQGVLSVEVPRRPDQESKKVSVKAT